MFAADSVNFAVMQKHAFKCQKIIKLCWSCEKLNGTHEASSQWLLIKLELNNRILITPPCCWFPPKFLKIVSLHQIGNVISYSVWAQAASGNPKKAVWLSLFAAPECTVGIPLLSAI